MLPGVDLEEETERLLNLEEYDGNYAQRLTNPQDSQIEVMHHHF